MTEKVCILIKVNSLARVDAVGSETGPGTGCCRANGNQVRVELVAVELTPGWSKCLQMSSPWKAILLQLIFLCRNLLLQPSNKLPGCFSWCATCSETLRTCDALPLTDVTSIYRILAPNVERGLMRIKFGLQSCVRRNQEALKSGAPPRINMSTILSTADVCELQYAPKKSMKHLLQSQSPFPLMLLLQLRTLHLLLRGGLKIDVLLNCSKRWSTQMGINVGREARNHLLLLLHQRLPLLLLFLLLLLRHCIVRIVHACPPFSGRLRVPVPSRLPFPQARADDG